MDQVTETIVAEMDARLARLETEHNRAPVRGVLGVLGGSDGLKIYTVNVLPELPAKKTILFLQSVDAGELPDVVPKPDAKDLYWWAAPNDDRWHPFGGKIADIAGDPGDMSEA